MNLIFAPGSSPLTRGKHQTDRVRIHSRGLIPAHAGKTRALALKGRSSEAHPRSRGENGILWSASVGVLGSSPLTRGKLTRAYEWGTSRRLIPAHAGKTVERLHEGKLERAHPRSRGENDPYTLPGVPGAGSSPLTRGKRVERGANLIHVRLIPAHAGKTMTCPSTSCTSRAHPRSRGENTRSVFTCCSATGSSPLTRGKLRVVVDAVHDVGLIPAHAGKTPGDSPDHRER